MIFGPGPCVRVLAAVNVRFHVVLVLGCEKSVGESVCVESCVLSFKAYKGRDLAQSEREESELPWRGFHGRAHWSQSNISSLPGAG